MRAVSMMSMPTSELIRARAARGRAGPVPGEPALRAAAHPARSRHALIVARVYGRRGSWEPARRAENRLSRATRAPRAHDVSFDRHRFCQIARLIGIVAPPVR